MLKDCGQLFLKFSLFCLYFVARLTSVSMYSALVACCTSKRNTLNILTTFNECFNSSSLNLLMKLCSPQFCLMVAITFFLELGFAVFLFLEKELVRIISASYYTL